MFDKSSCRDEDVVLVAESHNFRERLPWHETERSSRKLESIHIGTHGFEDVFQVSFAERRIVGSSYFRNSPRARLSATPISPQEGKRSVILTTLAWNGHSHSLTHAAGFAPAPRTVWILCKSPVRSLT